MFHALAQATQPVPTGTLWTPSDVVMVVTAILTAIAVTLIPALIALINAVKAKGMAESNSKSIDRLSGRANSQDERINAAALQSPPQHGNGNASDDKTGDGR